MMPSHIIHETRALPVQQHDYELEQVNTPGGSLAVMFVGTHLRK